MILGQVYFGKNLMGDITNEDDEDDVVDEVWIEKHSVNAVLKSINMGYSACEI